MGLLVAICLTFASAIHCVLLTRSGGLPLQVRIAFGILLICGLNAQLYAFQWILFVGVNALLVFNYCLLARLLVLMPWNRTIRFSLVLTRRVLTSPVTHDISQLTNPRQT